MSNVLTYTASATWHPRYGVRSITVYRSQEPVAIAPMPGTGRPTSGALDDALATLGFTRVTPWMDADEGLVCGVGPIRG